MKKIFSGTYEELRYQVSLTHVRGRWCDLGNQKQYRATSGAILNLYVSTGTVTFQGKGLAARKLETALEPAISRRQSENVAKASKLALSGSAKIDGNRKSNKTTRSVGLLRKAKITTIPLSPEFIGKLHLESGIVSMAKQSELNGQTEIICRIKAWVRSDESGAYLTVELSPCNEHM